MSAVPRDLTREHGLQLLQEMLRIRCFEDRCAELYSGGAIRGFCISTTARRRWPSG
jgi:TPP-dependent pyruvate/acetoin dehydrogenase alpha subunit